MESLRKITLLPEANGMKSSSVHMQIKDSTKIGLDGDVNIFLLEKNEDIYLSDQDALTSANIFKTNCISDFKIKNKLIGWYGFN